MLVLRSDKTFVRTQVDGCAPSGECSRSEDEGKYTFTRSGTKRFIRFTDSEGTLIDRWQYEVNAQSHALKLRQVATDAWQPVPYSDVAFCTAEAECSVQGLEEPSCSAGWSCERNACVNECGAGDPPQNACNAAGGTCKPLVPGACANGVILDPNEFSCGGPTGVLCCL